MPLSHDAPDEGFMRELREVARDAIALNESLTKPLNFDLPPDFPKSQLVDLCRSLEQLPDGTAEGSRAALEYARNRLPAIRRGHVVSEELDVSGGDLPPPVLREALIDQRLKSLIASVSTALDEYRRLAAEEPADISEPEAAVPQIGDVTNGAVARSAQLEATLAESKATVEATTNPRSQRADNLKREINDAVGLNRLARVELQMPKIFVNLYRRTVDALKDYPRLIKDTAENLKLGVDIIQTLHKRWDEFKHSSTTHLFEELKKTCDTLEAVGVRLEQRRTKATEDRMRAEGRMKVPIYPPDREQVRWIKPGGGRNASEVFCDVEVGPEMVVVPAGKFMMGSPDDEPERLPSEGRQHEVTFAQPFAIGRHAVTRGQFAAFVDATGHTTDDRWRDPGFRQDDSHPVVCVTWDDAKAYTSWLGEVTGRPYRLLLTEAEWEYAARAGTVTPFWLGSLFAPFERRRGLPIGNLTSQFFANLYLDGFDHFVTEVLQAPYVRYVDDFALFHSDSFVLASWRNRIDSYLVGRRLKLHPRKTVIQPTSQPAQFLGFELLADGYRRLPEDNVARFRNRLRGLRDRWRAGAVEPAEVDARIGAWVAHAQHADTWRLRQAIFRGGRYDPAHTPEAWTALCRRVVRGGAWNNNPRNLRSAQRNKNTTDNRNNNLGFRVASTLSARADAITVAPGEH